MCSVENRGNIFILTLTSNNEEENDEHRLNPTLITSIRSALADIKSQSESTSSNTAALITTATGKYFSNGFDLRWAQSSGPSSFLARLHQMVDDFKPLVADFLSLPMPTIAAVNGHAAAAGFALALCHDHILMRKDRGVLYMSEVDIGMTLPEYFNVLFREKIEWKARREVLMGGRKLKGEEGLKLGIVDEVFASAEEVVERGVNLGQQLVNRNRNGLVYAEIRKGLYPELCKELGLTRKDVVLPRL